MIGKHSTVGPGRVAPALLVLGAVAGIYPCQAALGQAPPAAATTTSAVPTPNQLASLQMLWSAMAAVDHANRTGNYSVLRDLGSPGFQARNNPANLAAIFAGLREHNVDVSSTLVVTPVWEIPPSMVQPGVLRMRGTFPLRPASIAFDLLFWWQDGWRLEGVAVQAQSEITDSPSR